MKSKRILNNKIVSASIWNFIGTFLLKTIAFISVPILTRIMSQSDYGVVSTYATYISFLSIFIGLSLNTASTNARIDFKDRYEDYNSSIIKASLIVFCFEIILANCFFEFIRIPLSISRVYMNFVFFIAYAEYIINTYYKINAVDYKFKNNLKISLTNAISSIVLSILFIVQFQNAIFARLLGQGLFAIIVAIFLFVLIGIKKSTCFKFSDIKYALTIAVPNIFHQISNMIMSQSDRVFILNICDSVSVAKYSVVYNFGLIMQLVWSAINEVWVPWLYRALHDDKIELIIKMSKIYLYVFTWLSVIATLIVPDCMKIFAPSSYFDAKRIIPPVILATYFIFLYSFFANIEIYYKKNKFMAIATFAVATANIIGNALFIPMFGYEAAAYTTLVSYILLMVMHYFFLTILFKKNIYPLKIFVAPILFMIGICIFVEIYLNASIVRYSCLFFILLITLFWVRKNKATIEQFIFMLKR